MTSNNESNTQSFSNAIKLLRLRNLIMRKHSKKIIKFDAMIGFATDKNRKNLSVVLLINRQVPTALRLDWIRIFKSLTKKLFENEKDRPYRNFPSRLNDEVKECWFDFQYYLKRFESL